MTYQRAIQLKNDIEGNIIFDNGIPNYIIITPRLEKEYKKLLAHINEDISLYNDELCKEFCSNNDYMLRAIVTESGKDLLKRDFL